jgi:DegV family protein with EDD domain
MTIKIITDSTSDIPGEVAARYGIIKVPLTVSFGDDQYKDGIEMTQEEFFDRLSKSRRLPTTSQVNPAAFMDIYREETGKGNEIISIHLSSSLSGTYQSAVVAAQTVDKNSISVIDSRSVTLALGVIVMKAAEYANAGMERNRIVEKINAFKSEVRILIVVDTLEYLRKGGRLSGAQAVIGGMLNIKPILTIRDGKVVLIDKARGQKKAMRRVIDIMKEESIGLPGELIGIANAACPETAEELKAMVREELGDVKFIESAVGCVIGTHAGPGAFGLIFV